MSTFEGLTFAFSLLPSAYEFFFLFFWISWTIFPFSHAGKKKRKGITANILTRKIIFCLLKNNHCQHPNKEILPLPAKPDPPNWPGPTQRIIDRHHQMANWNQVCISKNRVCRQMVSLTQFHLSGRWHQTWTNLTQGTPTYQHTTIVSFFYMIIFQFLWQN